MKKVYRRVIKITLWTVASIVLLLLVIGWILSSGIMTGPVTKFVGQYIDGELNFDKVKVSLLSHFPSVSITLTDASLTYPSSRFASLDSMYYGHMPMRLGKDATGSGKDTLAYFKKLTVASNVLKLLSGSIDVRNLDFESPRFYAKYYNDSTANWKMFNFPKSEEKEDNDSTITFPYDIDVRRIHLGNKPVANFCNPADSVFLFLDFHKIDLKGHLDIDDVLKSEADLGIDTLFLACAIKRDTTAYLIDRISLDAEEGDIRAEILSSFYLSGHRLQRKKVPFNVFISGNVSGNEKKLDVGLDTLKVTLAEIPLLANGDVSFEKGKIITDVKASIPSCNLDYLKKDYLDDFFPELKELEAGAVLTLDASAKGALCSETGTMPETKASLYLREGHFTLPVKNISTKIYLGARASMDSTGYVAASIDTLSVFSKAIDISVKGKAKDLLGKDPLFIADGKIFSDVDSLAMYLPEDFKYMVRGIVNADFSGKVKLSQCRLDRIAKADVKCKLELDSAVFVSPSDSISVWSNHISIGVGSDNNRFDKSFKQDARMLALGCKIDSVSAVIKDMTINGKKLFFGAQHSAEILRNDFDPENEIVPINGLLSIGKASFKKGDSLSIKVSDSKEYYKLSARPDNVSLPLVSLGSTTQKALVRFGTSRIMGKDVKADYTIYKKDHSKGKKGSRKAKIQRDDVPDWLKEEDFKKSDIDLGLSKEDRKFIRSWVINLNLKSSRIRFASPSFPLRTSVRNIDLHMDNDNINIGQMTLKAGRSNMKVQAKLKDMKNAFLRRGPIIADIDIDSDSLNVNELLSALQLGKENDDKKVAAMNDDLSFEQVQKAAADTLKAAEDADISDALVVIPSNLIAQVNLDAKKVKYSTLLIDEVSTGISVKERTAQVKDFKALSDIGNISLDAFYSTKTKTDLKCGFEVEFDNITSEEVIKLVPEIGEMMPMLNTFKGMLDCQIGITAQLDTAMNITPGTATGIIRVKGKDLQIEQDETIQEITRLLMFKDKEIAKIDSLSIEGLVENGKLTIFPCVIKLDRYTVALSGVQNVDESFKYHISLIRSPLLIKLGLDIYGQDFDHIKFKMVKPLYPNTNVPVYSKVIDSTRVNLKTSIRDIFRKGVQKAIESNEHSIGNIEVPDTTTVAVDVASYINESTGSLMQAADSLSK